MKRMICLDKEKCCGCGACLSICPMKAIVLLEDDEGFSYPQINEQKCIDCGKCNAVCPLINHDGVFMNEPMKILAARVRDMNVLKRSSSGGLFTVFSDILLKKHGIVYGAMRDESLNTKHVRVENSIERDKCCGSKYVQSDMRCCFIDVENDLILGKDVLFTGVACQIAALRNYLASRRCDDSRLYTIDVVCHGVPSPKLYRDFTRFVSEQRGKRLVMHYHRPKDHGWGHQEKLMFSDGSFEDNTMLSQVWRRMFYSENVQRPCCYQCAFVGKKRVSDISIGDFWGIRDVRREFDDGKGVSFALINSDKGNTLLTNTGDTLESYEVAWQQVAKKQERLRGIYPIASERSTFWTIYRERGFLAIAKKYGGYTYRRRMKNWVLRMLKK